jgi:murein endopeptidase
MDWAEAADQNEDVDGVGVEDIRPWWGHQTHSRKRIHQ